MKCGGIGRPSNDQMQVTLLTLLPQVWPLPPKKLLLIKWMRSTSASPSVMGSSFLPAGEIIQVIIFTHRKQGCLSPTQVVIHCVSICDPYMDLHGVSYTPVLGREYMWLINCHSHLYIFVHPHYLRAAVLPLSIG